MNEQLLALLDIDRELSIEEKLAALEEKQYEYIEREQSANDPARKEELADIIKKIDKEIDTIKENMKAIHNSIILDTGDEISKNKGKKEASQKSVEEKEAIDNKIAAMKQREAEKRAKAVEQIAATVASQSANGATASGAPASNASNAPASGTVASNSQSTSVAGVSKQTTTKADGTPLTENDIKYQKAAKEFNAGNHKNAMAMWEELAKEDYVEAQYTVGGMYLFAKDIPTDWNRGVFWLKKAADQGHTLAQYQYGSAYISAADHDRKKLNEGYKYLAMAADKDDQEAIKGYVNAVLKEYTQKSQIKQAINYCKRLKQITQDPYEAHQCDTLIKELKKLKKGSHKSGSGYKRSGSCLGRIIKWFIIISILSMVIIPSILEYMEKSQRYAEKNNSANVSQTQNEVEDVQFGDEIIEAHSMTPIESERLTLKSEAGFVFEDSLWDGAFVYRAGNGDPTAYAIYEVKGLFETITFEATPSFGTGNFFQGSSADLMIINVETNDILYSTTVKYDSGVLQIEADITGVNQLGIYVKQTSSGLGDLAYVFVRNMYLYPIGQSPEGSTGELVGAVYSIDGNIRANAGTEHDVLLVADGADFVATGKTMEVSDGAAWYEVYIDDTQTMTGWAHSSIITPK